MRLDNHNTFTGDPTQFFQHAQLNCNRHMMQRQTEQGYLEGIVSECQIRCVHFHPGRLQTQALVGSPFQHSSSNIGANNSGTLRSKCKRQFAGPRTYIQNSLTRVPTAECHCFAAGTSAEKFHEIIGKGMTVVMMQDMRAIIVCSFEDLHCGSMSPYWSVLSIVP